MAEMWQELLSPTCGWCIPFPSFTPLTALSLSSLTERHQEQELSLPGNRGGKVLAHSCCGNDWREEEECSCGVRGQGYVLTAQQGGISSCWCRGDGASCLKPSSLSSAASETIVRCTCPQAQQTVVSVLVFNPARSTEHFWKSLRQKNSWSCANYAWGGAKPALKCLSTKTQKVGYFWHAHLQELVEQVHFCRAHLS